MNYKKRWTYAQILVDLGGPELRDHDWFIGNERSKYCTDRLVEEFATIAIKNLRGKP